MAASRRVIIIATNDRGSSAGNPAHTEQIRFVHNRGMKIDVLHIDNCPNWQDAGSMLVELIDELGITNVVPIYTLITSAEDAAKVPFAGSPTILIDGVDVVAGATLSTDLACRIYWDGQRTTGIPTRDSMRRALIGRHPSRLS